MLRDGARRFVREQFSIEQRRMLAKSETGFSAEHWQSYADLGWLALGLPEDVGGLGCSMVETVILMEEFGRGLALGPYVSTAVLCAHLLDRSDNAEARAEVLAAVADGSRRLALAHFEPGERRPTAPINTRARRSQAGFVLSGVKSIVIDAPAADQLIVSARLDDQDGYSLFLVDRRDEHLVLHDYPLIDGARAADIYFTELPLLGSALLVGAANAQALLTEALDRDTLARVAEALGAMEAVLQLTSDYLKTRVQFGQPIGKFQALQHRMAEMFVEVQEVRSILYCALANLTAAPEQRSAAVSAAKVVTADAGNFVGGQGIQLHGGIGVTNECAVSHYYKKLFAFENVHGDAEWHLGRYAQHVAR